MRADLHWIVHDRSGCASLDRVHIIINTNETTGADDDHETMRSFLRSFYVDQGIPIEGHLSLLFSIYVEQILRPPYSANIYL